MNMNGDPQAWLLDIILDGNDVCDRVPPKPPEIVG